MWPRHFGGVRVIGKGLSVRQDWEPEDLIEVWTLLDDDEKRLRNKSGANRLGFALLLKFFEVEARFPESTEEIPAPAVAYVAQQVKVAPEEFAAYDWAGRAISRHRMEIRDVFRVPRVRGGGPGPARGVADRRAVRGGAVPGPAGGGGSRPVPQGPAGAACASEGDPAGGVGGEDLRLAFRLGNYAMFHRRAVSGQRACPGWPRTARPATGRRDRCHSPGSSPPRSRRRRTTSAMVTVGRGRRGRRR
ncbi:DUF4158 domain-containing protein [Streptomyces hygroscopicus]|uniref:DUF4158 domain-containing protein n=1 Tax=Streptomyces hygroscopicus TaxID=1912 RepID=UPI0036870082